MPLLLTIIFFTFTISLVAFVGAVTLFVKEELLDKALLFFVSFSAGALLGGAFLHLIPESLEELPPGHNMDVFLYVLVGFCAFFVLENFIHWHHHHAREHPKIMPFSYLILVSDAVHNFIDGLVVAASFVSSFHLGMVTTLSVALHEIPQEIGDFGILVYGGIERTRALFLNFLSAISVVAGGIAGFLLKEKLGGSIAYLLPFAAGNFIYIASSDLIPEIKSHQTMRSFVHFLVFLAGIGIMLLLKH
ncbi:MAG: ZIP family metal transporter [Candidatus Nealsonbacteria bacterium]|nr:ZIP family metal transporter [Candidatus Nealsonbacteria bacterium]